MSGKSWCRFRVRLFTAISYQYLNQRGGDIVSDELEINFHNVGNLWKILMSIVLEGIISDISYIGAEYRTRHRRVIELELAEAMTQFNEHICAIKLRIKFITLFKHGVPNMIR